IQNHAKATVRHNRPLQGRLGLQANDDFALSIDVARPMGCDRAGYLRDVQYALLALLDKEQVQSIPELFGALCCGCKEGLISLVGLVVLLDEVSNIDFPLPKTRLESMPWSGRF